jgi:hypothetical protein
MKNCNGKGMRSLRIRCGKDQCGIYGEKLRERSVTTDHIATGSVVSHVVYGEKSGEHCHSHASFARRPWVYGMLVDRFYSYGMAIAVKA